ncbi:MAG: ROK family protein [Atopobiaceae bacterium]|nr:ROK family protein [Atopobiaceae bacterium]MBR3315564.1 ROK family protein [Atopobiaceae bacterium]
MAQQFLVLDIGGTFIKYAIMDRKAQFITQGKVTTNTESEEALLTSLEGVREAVADYDYEGVAVSMPGRIETAAGIAHTGGAYYWLSEYPAAEKFGAIFDKPCTIANDGKCAAYAESWFGALSDVNYGCVLVLGTGIGGGIVLNKQVLMGCSGGAGELSLFVHNFDAAADPANEAHGSSNYTWTSRISALSITKKFAELKGLEKADGVMLFDAYEAGDPDAIAVIKEYAGIAAAGIMSLQSVLDLQRYAIGGGISARPEATSVIADEVNRIFDAKQNLPFSKPEVVTCQFGNEANLIGALAFHLGQ